MIKKSILKPLLRILKKLIEPFFVLMKLDFPLWGIYNLYLAKNCWLLSFSRISSNDEQCIYWRVFFFCGFFVREFFNPKDYEAHHDRRNVSVLLHHEGGRKDSWQNHAPQVYRLLNGSARLCLNGPNWLRYFPLCQWWLDSRLIFFSLLWREV